jgi:hypothetical protein
MAVGSAVWLDVIEKAELCCHSESIRFKNILF